jgi:hypothetical protein
MQRTIIARTVEAMNNIGKKPVPSYIEFTPRGSLAIDCEANGRSFMDDVSIFSGEELPMSQDHDTLSHNTSQVYYMMSHLDDVPRQDHDAMDLMVHEKRCPRDWIHHKNIPTIVENNDMKIGGIIKQHDIDVSTSDLQKMILDIRCTSPLTFINQCTLSLGATASRGVNEPSISPYDYSQPSEVFVRKVSQTQSMHSSLRPNAATTPSSAIHPRSNYDIQQYDLTTQCPAITSYCHECYDPCSGSPLVMYPTPKKSVEDIHGYDVHKLGPMPLYNAHVLPRAA